MMVTHLLAFVAPSAIMSISITLGCTFVCGYIPTSNTSSSSTSFYATYSSTYHYSTPLFSFDSSMYTGSIGVAPSLSYSFELQPLLGLPKTLLQMFLIYIYLELLNVQIEFSHGTIFLPHILKMMMNAAVTSLLIAKCLAS
jgi:hypothetical protein